MSTGAKHILLAEDNTINQKVAEKVLTKAGFTLDIASDGGEAVNLYKENEYSFILMDVHMPYMDGYEATAKIREIEKNTSSHIQIIAMTASVLDGDEDECIRAGMDHYLSKPLDVGKVMELTRDFTPDLPKSG